MFDILDPLPEAAPRGGGGGGGGGGCWHSLHAMQLRGQWLDGTRDAADQFWDHASDQM